MGKRETTGKHGCAGDRCIPLLEKAAEFYRKSLERNEEAFERFRAVGLTNDDLKAQYGIGYCDGRLLEILPRRDDVRATLTELGVLDVVGVEGEEELTERLVGCLTLPLRDREGGILGLCGLPADGGAAIKTNGAPGLWNLPAAERFPTLYVALTVMDALCLQAAGYANSIALVDDLPGARDLEALEDAGVQQLHLVNHRSISCATIEAFGSIPCFERRLSAPPSGVLQDQGAEELAANLEASPRRLLKSTTITTPTEILEGGFAVAMGPRRYEVRGLDKSCLKLKATVRVEHEGRLFVDTIDFYSARSRRALCRELCGIFNEASFVIETDLHRLLLIGEAYDPQRSEASDVASVEPIHRMGVSERQGAERFGKRPDLIEQVLKDYASCGLIGEESNKLLCYLAAVSRKTPEPLSVLILSSSGAGKSMLQDTTLSLCPPEDVVKLTSLTGKALFYKGRRSLHHKVLALEEEAGADRADYAIRNLISAGELIIETTVKDSGTGRLTTMQNRVEGPTSVFFTTTNPDVDPETRSRFFVTGVDESREQTRAILASQRKRFATPTEGDSTRREEVLRLHHNFQRLLKPIAVVNPFAEKLDYLDDRLQSRRDQPKVLNLIRAVAFLRQMSKPVKTRPDGNRPVDYIEVDETDLKTACELAVRVLRHGQDDMNQVSRDLLVQLDRMVANAVDGRSSEEPVRKTDVEFTRREIRAFTGWSHVRVHKYIQQLVELEYVYRVNGRGSHTHYYRLASENVTAGLDRVLLGDWTAQDGGEG